MKKRGAVLITGASTGLGRAAALRLDSLGFEVFAGVRRPADGEALVASAAQIKPVLLDVTRPPQIEEARQKLEDEVQGAGLIGLVNNAGIVVSGPIEFLTTDDFRRQFEVNVFGLLAVTRTLIPLLRRAGGRVVIVGSISGRSAMPFMSPYAASKFALEAIADSMRVELKSSGIGVSLLEPGSIRTPLFNKYLRESERLLESLPEEGRRRYGSYLEKVGRIASRNGARGTPPEKVAETIVHALTAKKPRARYLTGLGPRQMLLLEILPWRVRDWILLRVLGG